MLPIKELTPVRLDLMREVNELLVDATETALRELEDVSVHVLTALVTSDDGVSYGHTLATSPDIAISYIEEVDASGKLDLADRLYSRIIALSLIGHGSILDLAIYPMLENILACNKRGDLGVTDAGQFYEILTEANNGPICILLLERLGIRLDGDISDTGIRVR